MSKLGVMGEFVLFLRQNKKLWLLPIVLTLGRITCSMFCAREAK